MTSADAPTLVDWLQGWGAAAGVLLSALAVVRNNSDGEICDASVVLTVRNSSATRRALDAPVRPKDFGTTKIPLAPTADAPSGDLDSIRRRLALPADAVTLRFIDSSGRRWVRKGMSEPRRDSSGTPQGR